MPLHISRVENQVFVQDAITIGDVETGGDAAALATASTQASQFQTILISINHLDQRQSENNQKLQAHKSELRNYTPTTQFHIMHTHMMRFSLQHVMQLGGAHTYACGGVVHTCDDYHDSTTKLAHYPRTLLLLWHAYLYGFAGNKPAKNFTSVERGKVKFKYCWRKVFWTIMVNLVNAGFTKVSAIEIARPMELASLSQMYSVS